MPVTIIPACHQPKSHPKTQPAGSLDRFLHHSCADAYLPGKTRIVASSFEGTNYYPSSSSFVRSAIEAWGHHSHLVLRPEDIWFSILVQMNFFMEKHAESLRHLFVCHPERTRLEVWANDWDEVMDKFRAELQDNIKTSWMSDWISPGFSTSTVDDERVSTVLMMGMMKAYFDYAGGEICGIPSITLLGTKRDWQRLLRKIDRLDDFGDEPKAYALRLRPILSRIVRSFDSPLTTETKDFWDQMVQARVRHSRGCGQPPKQYMVSGWIVGLLYWQSTGSADPRLSGRVCQVSERGSLQYDGVSYGDAPLEDLPIGYAKAKFEMLTGYKPTGEDTCHGWVLAGSIGKSILDGAPEGYVANLSFHGRVESRSEKTYEEHKTEEQGNEENDGKEQASEANVGTGCFSGLLQSLNCFRGKRTVKSAEDSASSLQDNSEKQAGDRVVKMLEPEGTHSTIQPMSGWFLFGPEEDTGPFFDTEEIDGPTVDAIDSCEGVQHERTYNDY